MEWEDFKGEGKGALEGWGQERRRRVERAGGGRSGKREGKREDRPKRRERGRGEREGERKGVVREGGEGGRGAGQEYRKKR